MPTLSALLARDIARLENAGATIPAEKAAVSERLLMLRQAATVVELASELVDTIGSGDSGDDSRIWAAAALLEEALASDIASV